MGKQEKKRKKEVRHFEKRSARRPHRCFFSGNTLPCV
jgi:hypothetical protein